MRAGGGGGAGAGADAGAGAVLADVRAPSSAAMLCVEVFGMTLPRMSLAPEPRPGGSFLRPAPGFTPPRLEGVSSSGEAVAAAAFFGAML